MSRLNRGAFINWPARTPTTNARSQISCTTAGSTPGNKSAGSFRGVPTVSNCAAAISPAICAPVDTARPASTKSTGGTAGGSAAEALELVEATEDDGVGIWLMLRPPGVRCGWWWGREAAQRRTERRGGVSDAGSGAPRPRRRGSGAASARAAGPAGPATG
ncbi:hypothetical protein SO3561_08939 [Streptomyces olivochromogenes]|uniref:Uncharacterized protein n=1 Tax=Streptomyces olivochromogenes TaxID=1963 RepID=A0A250VTE8_STROL|nr:hypothetical protein SO3561_08939 [Streptomyces olivochromogenes]